MKTNISKLIEEAKAKGFVKGSEYINVQGDRYIAKYDARMFYKSSDDDFWLDCGDGQGLIYKHKEWGKVISNKKEIDFIDSKKMETPKHYDNSKGSIYQFCENQNLNSWEFDCIKRIVRCRKKGNFKEDLEKTKHLIDLYLKEYDINTNK